MTLEIKPGAKLSSYTTFKLGGPCVKLIECAKPEELISALALLTKEGTPFILIGGGSNIVVSDQGLKMAVIRYYSANPLITHDGNLVTVTGSTLLDDLALYGVSEGLAGLNFCSGIPGTVGGAVVGNAGAWGKQVGDCLERARIRLSDGSVKIVSNDYFKFTYRHSALKETSDIVIDVTFKLTDGDPAQLASERADILRQRAEKHPNLNTHPCAGSFFRNIEPTSKADKRQASGWFLEQVGGKDLKVGGAYIFEKHANIIVKGTGGSAEDVYQIQEIMKKKVKEQFNLDLVREVRFAGKFKSNTEQSQEGFW